MSSPRLDRALLVAWIALVVALFAALAPALPAAAHELLEEDVGVGAAWEHAAHHQLEALAAEPQPLEPAEVARVAEMCVDAYRGRPIPAAWVHALCGDTSDWPETPED